jgi:flavodoxin
MKTLVVYDSVHGNTGTIAQAIGDAIPGEVTVLRVGAVSASDLAAYDLLIVGSPTHGGRATDAIQDLLKQVQPPALEGTRVAAFDTRFSARWVRIFGFAAPRIAKSLKEKGGTPVGSPGDFIVKGTEGPLKEGEVERAAAWAKEIAE